MRRVTFDKPFGLVPHLALSGVHEVFCLPGLAPKFVAQHVHERAQAHKARDRHCHSCFPLLVHTAAA